MAYLSDHVGSDEMDDILELSRTDSFPHASSSTTTMPSTNGHHPPTSTSTPVYAQRTALRARLTSLDKEISSVDADIAKLQQLRASLVQEKAGVQRELEQGGTAQVAAGVGGGSKAKGKEKGTDYMDEFEWSGELLHRARKVFDIKEFRFCQKGVCNANMDGRDIVCVMPTGGGKSLTYQLPALLTPGTTVVISPLVSLITDQILHLREAGVEAVMITGATSKEESKEIFVRLGKRRADRGGKGKAAIRAADGGGGGEEEIKLCYVTPERIAKSKTFMSLMEKMALDARLARIVVDEAHCVSSLGHDFRPDYKKLSILKQLFPNVPILALSATCPPTVLKDLLQILRLSAIVDGTCAPVDGTVYFSSPLYRKNLRYSVLPKPSSQAAQIKLMAEYILSHHPNESGIVYCLSKKDTQTVADGIAEASGGKIRTGVYHADVGDAEKEGIHRKWRNGQVQVVCATIAFGLGIDKGDVRFVLHHSMSKSIDGFYQESGRAGRDGKEADCVLYYRGQDATRLSSLICGEVGGTEKLHEMLRFAQNLTDCRKVLFARYFSASSALATSAWEDPLSGSSSLTRCTTCDNCTRPASSLSQKDVTVQAWQLCRIVEAVCREGGRVTAGILSDLARGVGGGAFAVSAGGGGRKRKRTEKAELDLEEVAGGKVELSKDDIETLAIQLILDRYLAEDFHQTAYAINVYLSPGSQATRLTRLPKSGITSGSGPRIECAFAVLTKKRAAAGGKGKSAAVAAGGGKKGKGATQQELQDLNWPPARAGSSSKRKASTATVELDVDSPEEDDPDDVAGDDEEDFDDELRQLSPVLFEVDDDEAEELEELDESGDGDEWQFSLAGRLRRDSGSASKPLGKRARTRTGEGGGGGGLPPGVTSVWEDGQETIVISSP